MLGQLPVMDTALVIEAGKVNDQEPVRLEDAADLAQYGQRVDEVLEHVVQRYHVKAGGRERHVVQLAHIDVGRLALDGNLLPPCVEALRPRLVHERPVAAPYVEEPRTGWKRIRREPLNRNPPVVP